MMLTTMLSVALMTTPTMANGKRNVNHQLKNDVKVSAPQNVKDKKLDTKVDAKEKKLNAKADAKVKQQDSKIAAKDSNKSFWSFSFKPTGKNVTQQSAVAVVKKLNGVQKAIWNSKTKKLTVVYDSRKISTAQIMSSVNKAHR